MEKSQRRGGFSLWSCPGCRTLPLGGYHPGHLSLCCWHSLAQLFWVYSCLFKWTDKLFYWVPPPISVANAKIPLAGDRNSHKSLTLPHFVAINQSVFLAVIFLVFTGFVKWMQLKYLSKYEALCRGGSHEVSLKPPDDVHVSAGVFVFWS